MRETNGIYDSTVVLYNLDLTYISFLIITLSCYEPFTRPKFVTAFEFNALNRSAITVNL